MGQKIEPSQIALIVEDDPEVRALAAALLEETQLQVVETATAEEALDYQYSHADNVAFLFASARLPRLISGVDLARTVRVEWPWVRTVLASSEPLGRDSGRVPRDVRLMPKSWRALEVLIEAEKARSAHRRF